MGRTPRRASSRLSGRTAGAAALIAGTLLFGACKDASRSGTSSLGPGGGTLVEPIPPSSASTAGCFGPDQAFANCQELDLSAALVGLVPAVSTLTRIAGAQAGSDTLYATAVLSASGDSTVLELDLADPQNPVLRHLVPVDALDALVTSLLGGVNTQARLAGLCVYDATAVLTVELESNTILAVGRGTPGFLAHFAGVPDAAPGFFDGDAHGAARFAFDAESELAPTGDGRLFVADTGNHALRVVFSSSALDPSNLVVTAVGGGPGSEGEDDGELALASLDSPTGVVVHCADRLILTERGDGGFGHRLRGLAFTGFDPSTGALTGELSTLVGDGTASSTEGPSLTATVAGPQAPEVSASGEVYWIDRETGVLRRERTAAVVDCPLAPMGDCATASTACSAGGDFAPGKSFSTALSGDGDLYVLQSGTTLLRRFGP